MLTLYNYFRSSASYRVRIALHLKNLSYQELEVHLLNNGGEQYSPAYQEINRQSMVPTLQNDSHIITQSLAILEYLEEQHPEPSLLPKDVYLKALSRAFAYAIAADIHPLNNLRVLQYLTGEMGVSEEKKICWYHHWIDITFAALEKQLSQATYVGEFCFGDSPTLADICLVPQIYNARRYQMDLHQYPTLVRIDANCQKLPAFQKAYPKAL